MDDSVTLLARVLFGAIAATLVMAVAFYAVHRLRVSRRPRPPTRGGEVPAETDGALRPILFERVTLDELDGPGPRC